MPRGRPLLSNRALTLSTVWLIAAGMLLLLVAGGLWLWELRRLRTEQVAPATITEYIARQDASGRVLFYPHLRFRTPDGVIQQFVGPNGTNPAPFTAGENVRVIYPKGHPEAARIASHSAGHPVSAPVALAGIILFDFGGFFWIALYLRRRKARLAAPPL